MRADPCLWRHPEEARHAPSSDGDSRDCAEAIPKRRRGDRTAAKLHMRTSGWPIRHISPAAFRANSPNWWVMSSTGPISEISRANVLRSCSAATLRSPWRRSMPFGPIKMRCSPIMCPRRSGAVKASRYERGFDYGAGLSRPEGEDHRWRLPTGYAPRSFPPCQEACGKPDTGARGAPSPVGRANNR